MERLTYRGKLNKKAYCANASCRRYCEDCEHFRRVLEKLAEYEDAEDKGMLLKLPFLPKPGMKLYDIYGVIENGEAEPREITVRSFNITHARMWYFHINNEVFTFDDFGKTYFLTREEAESALAEKGGAEWKKDWF